ncbi:N-acetyltransferase B complex (NatB) non catalytic subunit [Toxoplasma gondii ARI]|uniref:N-acetyltransferase B complex (NatB) non catalytic subunit n=1 Tax=Toxoplasma gondii ARI TaxID=1074872 RepID=A0A139XZU5_TOXGO|nr:N-acetyltransferase B complex (NatB) non catalytic subunit [Toxoplasma gondii ARI]
MAAASRKARDQIRAALDAGENKQAARLASQNLLKKSKGAPGEAQGLALKALRAIALARDGQERDAVTLAREVERAVEKDDETARLCSVAFKELREIYYLPPSRIDSRRYPPLEETEEVTAFLDAVAASTTGHFERLLPSALRLFSRFKNPRYLQWALVCMLLHDASPVSKATWALAAKLMAKLPALEPSMSEDSHYSAQLMSTAEGCCERRDNYARLILMLSVLRQNGQYGEALDLLAAHNDLCLVPGEELALRLQLLLEGGRVLEAFQISEKLLDEQPFNTLFAENCIRLGLSLEAENVGTGNACLTPWKEKWEAEKQTSFEASQALLSLHRLRALRFFGGSLSDKSWTDERLHQAWTEPARSACISEIVSFVTTHGHDSRSFSTLRSLLGCCPSSMREMCLTALESLHGPWKEEVEKQLARMREGQMLAAADNEQKDAKRQSFSQLTKPLKRFVCLEKLLHALGRYKVVSSSSAAAVTAWVQLRSDLHSAAPEISDVADDLLLLTVDVLLLFDHHVCQLGGRDTPAPAPGQAELVGEGKTAEEEDMKDEAEEPLAQRRFFFAALTLLSSEVASRQPAPASSASPASTHASPAFRALLLWLTGCMGLVETSRRLFFSSLDIKNVMLFSLGFPHALPLVDYGASPDVVSFSRLIQDGNEENTNSLSDALIASFEEGTYSAIPEFLFIQPLTSSSLFTSLVDLDATLSQPLCASAPPPSSVSLHEFSYCLACRQHRSFTASPSSVSALLLLFSASRRAARAGASGFSADLTSLALSLLATDGAEAEPKTARLGLLCLDKETVALNLSLPTFSSSRVRHLSDPIQRSLCLHRAETTKREEPRVDGAAQQVEAINRAGNEVPFVQAAEALERAVVASQTLANPWTPVAPARLIAAEALEALPRCRSPDFLRLVHSLASSSSSAERGDSGSSTAATDCEARSVACQGEREEQLLCSLYGPDWTEETNATGNAIGGGNALRTSKATEVMTRLIEGIPKRIRMRRLTLLSLLPPSAFPSPVTLSSVCHHLREELSELGSTPSSRCPSSCSLSAPSSASTPVFSPSSSLSGVVVGWPSLGATLPTGCALTEGTAPRPNRSGAEPLLSVWMHGVDMLDASQNVLQNSRTARKQHVGCGTVESEETAESSSFLVSLDSFVRGASALFAVSLRSIRHGFAAFLGARFGRTRREKFERQTASEEKERKKGCRADGDARADTNEDSREDRCVLPIWDAFYILASFAKFPLATAAAAIRNALTSGGSKKEEERMRQAILKKIALFIIDLEEVQAEAKHLARAADDLSDDDSDDKGDANVHHMAWWMNTSVELGGSGKVLRFPFTETKAFSMAARNLARDALASYAHILSCISKALAARRQWLLEAASSSADVGSG